VVPSTEGTTKLCLLKIQQEAHQCHPSTMCI